MHDKTTIRDSKGGLTTIKKSLYNFPKDLHIKTLELADGDTTVGEIYSEAIRKFRKEYDKNKHLGGKWVIRPEKGTGSNIQVWLTKEANDDLEYLVNDLKSKNVYMIYSAMSFYYS